MTYRIPDRPIPWQAVKPFRPTQLLTDEVKGYLRRCSENEPMESIIARVFPDNAEIVKNYLEGL